MTDYPAALIEKVAKGIMAVWHGDDDSGAWESWADEAYAALDALAAWKEEQQ